MLALGYRVVVVDDGSRDRTAAIAREKGAKVLIQRENRGKGFAIRRGFKFLKLKEDCRVIALMDGDGQHDPKEIASFLSSIAETQADVVVGNRMHHPKDMPLLRRATNWFMSSLLSLIARQPVPDSQCGFRALTVDVVSKLDLKTRRFEVESEMLLEAAHLGATIRSVPIGSIYRNEVSQIHPWKDTYRFLRFLITYLYRRCFGVDNLEKL